MEHVTLKRKFIVLCLVFAFSMTRASAQSVSLTPATVVVYAGSTVTFTATASEFCGDFRNYVWTVTGGTSSGVTVNGLESNTNIQDFTFNTTGLKSVSVNVNRTGYSCSGQSVTTTVNFTVLAGTAPAVNMWGATNGGERVSNFTFSSGALTQGPVRLFDPFPSSTNTTAAVGRSPFPTPTTGHFYWLANTTNNEGFTEVWGATGTGGSITSIGTLDMNGGGDNNLGFVRLAVGPDGRGWILAGDGSTVYLAKFSSNGVTPVPITMEDANGVTLVGGAASTFQNGDLALDGSGNIYALANNGSGITQIFIGQPNGNNTTLTKKWDLVDNTNSPFTGRVNGVAFDVLGSLYISTDLGIYYINQATVNGPAGTVQAALVSSMSGLTDLGTNVYPSTTLLPVKFGDFTVIKQGRNAILDWTTFNEYNTNHFEIERSYDGVNFTKIGTKEASGFSADNRVYQFTDPIVSNAAIIYYRIRTVDIDAKSALSKIIALRLGNPDIKNFTVYPSPFTSDLKIQVHSPNETDAVVRINNAIGQPVVSQKSILQRGDNVVVLSAGLSALPPGIYVLELIVGKEKLSQKIIKR